MIFATTSAIQGREVEAYLGVVFGDTVLGVNVFKDFMAGLRDIVGGRSGTYERELGAARDSAMANLARQAESLGATRCSASTSTTRCSAPTTAC